MTTASTPARPRRYLRWALFAVAAVFFLLVLREAFNPFGDRDYTEIPHGSHSHYVPKDRDPDVPMDRFPTRPPAANEKIMPDGRVVPR